MSALEFSNISSAGRKVKDFLLSQKAFKSILLFLIIVPVYAYALSHMTSIQNLLIKIGEIIKGRTLNHEYWQTEIEIKGLKVFKKFLSPKALLLYLIYGYCFVVYNNHFSEKNKKLFSRICSVAFFVFYAFITLYTVIKHEPWFDEFHAWDIARYYTIPQIFYEMRYEGHFVLWYLILYPLAHFGAPMIFLNLVSWSVMVFSVAFFIKKAPFAFITKIAVLVSSVFLYTYPVVSRCYCLIAPLVFLLASIHGDKNKALIRGMLLALLANTQAYIEGLCGILLLEFTIEWRKERKSGDANTRKMLIGVVMGWIGMLIAFLQVAPAFWSSSITVAGRSNMGFHLSALETFLSGSNIYGFISRFVFIILLLVYLCFLFSQERKTFVIIILSIVYMMLFCTTLYPAQIAHRGTLWFLIFIYACWRLNNNSEYKYQIVHQILIIAFSCLLFAPGMNINDWHNLYSQYSISHICKTVKQTIPKGSNVYSYGNDAIQCDLLDYQVYNLMTGKPGIPVSFKRADNSSDAGTQQISLSERIDNLLETENQNGFYLVGFAEEIFEPYNESVQNDFEVNLIAMVPNGEYDNNRHWCVCCIRHK